MKIPTYLREYVADLLETHSKYCWKSIKNKEGSFRVEDMDEFDEEIRPLVDASYDDLLSLFDQQVTYSKCRDLLNCVGANEKEYDFCEDPYYMYEDERSQK